MDRKKYEDYVNRQSDAESGVLFYAEARRLLDELVAAFDNNRHVDVAKYHSRINDTLEIAEQILRRTRNKDFLSLVENLRVALAQIGVS